MNVTDEMVESALDHFYNYSPFNGPDELKAGMRRCIEAALSHAAGQEATTNPAEIDRKSVGGEAVADDGSWVVERNAANCPTCGASCVAEVRAWYDQHLGSQRRTNYLTPAQPPASAEVGRDAERLDWLRNECARLEPFSIPTGAGDSDIGWQVVKYYQAEPRERVISTFAHEDPRVTIDAAMAAYSGRKESPIAGVTNGTDEGLGNLGPQGTHTKRQG